MEKQEQKKYYSKARITRGLLICLFAITMQACHDNADEINTPNGIDELNVIDAEEAYPADEESARVQGNQTKIDFGDRTACNWTPSICETSFVPWPGYIQETGGQAWGTAWMSYGPKKTSIPYTDKSAHYHIAGLAFPDTQPNPAMTAMFGYDWFLLLMSRDSKNINFDLTQIKVNGTVPITLWFRNSEGKWYRWLSLKPGRWNLPGAINIDQIHIRAASAAENDKYSVDDIVVRGRYLTNDGKWVLL